MAKETWETSSMVKAWQENEDAPTWEVFTDALIAHPHCPENYTEHTIRRRVSLLKYQFAKAGYDAPPHPPFPSSKSSSTADLAEALGLKANPNAIDPYNERRKAREDRKAQKAE